MPIVEALLAKSVQVSSCWSALKPNPEWMKSGCKLLALKTFWNSLFVIKYMPFMHTFKIFKNILLFHIGYVSFVVHISLESIFHSCYFKMASFFT